MAAGLVVIMENALYGSLTLTKNLMTRIFGVEGIFEAELWVPDPNKNLMARVTCGTSRTSAPHHHPRDPMQHAHPPLYASRPLDKEATQRLIWFMC